MADSVIPDYVTEARAKAEQAGQTYSDLAAGSYTIGDRLKQVINETLNYNKDIIDLRASALSDYLASPAIATAKFSSPTLSDGSPNPNYILNPYEANKAIAMANQSSEIPFLSLNQLLGMRQKGEGELLNSAVGGYQAQVEAAKGAYDAARTTYGDLLNEFKLSSDIQARNASAGAGSSAKRFGAIQEAVQTAASLVNAITQGGKQPITRDQYDQIYGSVFDQLSAQGIQPSDSEMAYISGQKQGAESLFKVPQPAAPEGFSSGGDNLSDFNTIEPGAQSAIQPDRGWLGKISDFLHLGQESVAPSAVDLSNLNRGISNVNNFDKRFDFGPSSYSSATLR